MLPVIQTPSELRGGGRLARALKAHHHDGNGGRGVKVDALAVGAQCRDQLVMYDLDHHLARRDRFHHLDADRLFFHAFGKTARNVKRDIGTRMLGETSSRV